MDNARCENKMNKMNLKENLGKIPMVTADGVVIKEGKVLLIKRDITPFQGHWVLPGGFVEYGEQLENAAKREVFEETGLKVEIEKFVGVYDTPDRDPRGQTISAVYLCKVISGELKGSREGQELKWFGKGELPEKIGFDHKLILKDVGFV